MALFAKQKQFLEAFKSQEYLYMLYGGAVGGGKSILQIGILDQMAHDYPGTKYAIVRKNLKTLKRTSIPSFRKVMELNGELDSFSKNFNRSEYVYRYDNGSEIHFVEADITKDPDFDKLKGLEITGALIEEANEIAELAFNILKTRCGRWNNTKYGIRPFIMLNCNPAKNWVKELFYDTWAEGTIKAPYYYLPALPTDNPHNSQDYLDALDTLPEAERKRFKEGEWDYADEPNQLIQYSWWKEQVNDTPWAYNSREDIVDLFLGVDVADSEQNGANKSSLVYIQKGRIVKKENHKCNTNTLADIVSQRIEEYRIPHHHVGVDCDGIGVGTYNDLVAKGLSVYKYRGSDSADKQEDKILTYKNKRAQAHWEFREDIRLLRLEVYTDKEMQKQALAITYEADERVIQIVKKEEIKKKLNGESPDDLDAAVIANYVKNHNKVGFDNFFKKQSLNKGRTRVSRMGMH